MQIVNYNNCEYYNYCNCVQAADGASMRPKIKHCFCKFVFSNVLLLNVCLNVVYEEIELFLILFTRKNIQPGFYFRSIF